MSDVSSGGVGFFGLLQLMLIGLKLTGYIDWSWWWVLAPALCCVALVIAVICVVLLGLLFVFLLHIITGGG